MPGAGIDLASAMKKAGMNAVVMTFAVDYVPLSEKGQAYRRFLNGMDGQAAMLRFSGIELSLNADDVERNFKAGKPVVIQSVEGGHILWATCTSPLVFPRTYSRAISEYFPALERGFDSLVSFEVIKRYLWNESGPLNYELGLRHVPSQQLPPLYIVTLTFLPRSFAR